MASVVGHLLQPHPEETVQFLHQKPHIQAQRDNGRLQDILMPAPKIHSHLAACSKENASFQNQPFPRDCHQSENPALKSELRGKHSASQILLQRRGVTPLPTLKLQIPMQVRCKRVTFTKHCACATKLLFVVISALTRFLQNRGFTWDLSQKRSFSSHLATANPNVTARFNTSKTPLWNCKSQCNCDANVSLSQNPAPAQRNASPFLRDMPLLCKSQWSSGANWHERLRTVADTRTMSGEHSSTLRLPT